MTDHYLLSIIIEKSYNTLSDAEKNNIDKKIDNFDNIVEFVRKLPDIFLAAIAYPALYEVMKSNNHLSSPKMVILSSLVQECISMPNFIIVSQEGKNKLLALRTCADTVISKWTDQIRGGNYEKIKLFSMRTGLYRTSFKSHIPNIMKFAYSNRLSNTESILNFIPNLYNLDHRAVALSYLFEGMKINNQLDSYQYLMLAYQVKSDMDSPFYDTLKKDMKNMFENIKSSFKEGLRALLYNPCLIIESRRHPGYALYGRDIGTIYTFPLLNFGNTKNIRWKVGPSDHGRYFSFRNTENDLYLYSEEEEVNGVTWNKGSYDFRYWQLYPIGESFKIQNKGNNRILNSNSLNWNIIIFRVCSRVSGDLHYSGDIGQHWMFK